MKQNYRILEQQIFELDTPSLKQQSKQVHKPSMPKITNSIQNKISNNTQSFYGKNNKQTHKPYASLKHKANNKQIHKPSAASHAHKNILQQKKKI